MTNFVESVREQVVSSGSFVVQIFGVLAGLVGLFLAWGVIRRAVGGGGGGGVCPDCGGELEYDKGEGRVVGVTCNYPGRH